MKLNKKTIIKFLDSMYDNVLEGLLKTPSIEELAEDYIKQNGNCSHP